MAAVKLKLRDIEYNIRRRIHCFAIHYQYKDNDNVFIMVPTFKTLRAALHVVRAHFKRMTLDRSSFVERVYGSYQDER